MMLTDEQKKQLNEVEQICFHGCWTEQMLYEELENPFSVLVTEERGGRIIGFALGRVVADEGEMYQVCVHPDFRREHIGKSLLSQLCEAMKQKGAACCFLEVRSRNAPAIGMYESCGFKQISVRKNYYKDDDGLIYKLSL